MAQFQRIFDKLSVGLCMGIDFKTPSIDFKAIDGFEGESLVQVKLPMEP